jgi:hypothetical protein
MLNLESLPAYGFGWGGNTIVLLLALCAGTMWLREVRRERRVKRMTRIVNGR